jgi:hypothetical protein
MASFPAVRPSIRRYGFGLFPVTTETGFGGGSVRFLHADNRYGISLELGYEVITQSEAQQIRDHYRSRQGGALSFMLPNIIWAGHSNPDNIVALGTSWIYAAAPNETHRSGLLFDVTVRLLQVI